MATLLYALVDPDAGVARVVSAAHPAPLVVSPSGSAVYVDVRPEPPLGTTGVRTFEETEVHLQPGTTMLFYTDGLIERRGERLSEGRAALARAAAAAPFDPELLCVDVCEALVGEAENRDDVAILALQPVGATAERIELEIAARPDELPAIRRLLRRWLRSSGVAEAEISPVLLAAGEACTNAIEHAYGPADAVFWLIAECHDGEVTIEVRDTGRWREPRGQNRGRGLALMEVFMDSVAVERADEGTTVTLVKRVNGGELARR